MQTNQEPKSKREESVTLLRNAAEASQERWRPSAEGCKALRGDGGARLRCLHTRSLVGGACRSEGLGGVTLLKQVSQEATFKSRWPQAISSSLPLLQVLPTLSFAPLCL